MKVYIGTIKWVAALGNSFAIISPNSGGADVRIDGEEIKKLVGPKRAGLVISYSLNKEGIAVDPKYIFEKDGKTHKSVKGLKINSKINKNPAT